MSNYQTKQSSHTVSSVALFSIVAANIIADPHGMGQAELKKLLYKNNAYQASVNIPTLDQYRNIITGEYHQERDPAEGVVSARLNPFIVQLNHWVDSVSTPQKWVEEGVQQPSPECRKLAKSAVLQLFKQHQLYPTRISATIEEGIFVNYSNHVNRRNLSIEIYNDLDIAAIVTRDKEIVISVDISNEDFTQISQILNAA